MTKRTYAVAIDGPAGAGKSTLARRAARDLGFYYVDTGAVYRTVGYHMDFYGIGPRDTDGINRLLGDVNIAIRYDDEGVQHMILNGRDVTGDIRTPEMSAIASVISAQPAVREYLLEMQRELARAHSVVMDGRDIGTVVLPDADVKIFLTADPEVRARRRYEELLARGEKVAFENVLADLQQRDRQDSERKLAPLKRARDAVLLDTTAMDLEQAAAALETIVKERLGL